MKYMFVGMVCFIALQTHAMEQSAAHASNPQSFEPVKIIFDNHANDTVISLNDGVVQIKPGDKNITATSVKKVEIKLTDGALLQLWLVHELQKVKRITVTKDKETGEYIIIQDPA